MIRNFIKSVPGGVLWLGVVSLLNDLSSEVIARVLPLFLMSIVNTTFVGIGFVEAVSEATSILGKLFSGYFSDKMRQRKPFIVGGYALSVISRPLLLFTGTLAAVVSSRFLDKVGKSIRTAPRDAFIADLSDEHTRGLNFGIHRALDTVGAVLGLAGVALFLYLKPMTDNLALWWILAFAAVAGLLSLPVLFIFIHDPPAKKTELKKNPQLSLKNLNPDLRTYLLIAFFFALASSSDAFLVIRARELGFSLIQIFLILVAFNIVSVPSYVGLASLSDRLGRKIILILGWLIYVSSYFFFGLQGLKPTFFVIGMLFYGLYYGFTDGVEKALIADFESGENKGQAFGWLAVVQGVGVIPANLLFGLIYQKIGVTQAFWFSGSMALIGVLGLSFFNPKKLLKSK